MKKFIVMTTIYDRNQAIESYEEYASDWGIIIVGDRKSIPYRVKNGEFITIEDQLMMSDYVTPRIMPENTPARRLIGVLKALEYGADLIAFLDDDNIMRSDWGKNIYVGQFPRDRMITNTCNILMHTSRRDLSNPIWARGLPLEYIDELPEYVSVAPGGGDECVCQENFWYGDGDVDGMIRLTGADIPLTSRFYKGFVPQFTRGYHPINSQNTIMAADYAPLFYQFIEIGRMGDIWGGYIAQRIIFGMEKCVCFAEPTVVQRRHHHDLIRDFNDEILGYKMTNYLLERLVNYTYNPDKSMIDNWAEIAMDLSADLWLGHEYIEGWVVDVKRASNKRI